MPTQKIGFWSASAWSMAAESALASASVFVGAGGRGGAIPDGVLLGVRGTARFRSVALGGPGVHRFHTEIADPSDASEVHMSRDHSFALLLDLKRRLKAVLDVHSGVSWYGLTLSRGWSLVRSGVVSCVLVLLDLFLGKIWMMAMGLS